jgi:Mor family transcriptional regulator
MSKRDTSVHLDMIRLCADAVGNEAAGKGIRALFRHFGGQIIYVPLKKKGGGSAEKICGVLADAVGDKSAQQILEKLMLRFGGLQVYIPREQYAFRENIALEIYERNYVKNEPMGDLAREYGISFSFAYTIWKEGQHKNVNKKWPIQ